MANSARAAEAQSALEAGQRDVAALERFPDLPAAVLARWFFVEGTDREETVLADLRRICEKTGYLVGGQLFVPFMPWKFDQAHALLSPIKGIRHGPCSRPCPGRVAKWHPRANQLLDEVTAQALGAWDLYNSQLILRFLGRKKEAIEVSRKSLAQPDRFPTVRKDAFRRALEYCAGQRSEADLLQSVQASRLDLSNAHVSIALSALADGDRKKRGGTFNGAWIPGTSKPSLTP